MDHRPFDRIWSLVVSDLWLFLFGILGGCFYRDRTCQVDFLFESAVGVDLIMAAHRDPLEFGRDREPDLASRERSLTHMRMSEGSAGNQVALRPYNFPAVRIMFPTFVFMLDGDIKTPSAIGQRSCLYRNNVYFIGRGREGRREENGED